MLHFYANPYPRRDGMHTVYRCAEHPSIEIHHYKRGVYVVTVNGHPTGIQESNLKAAIAVVEQTSRPCP
jgi:hypothetical protein